MTHHLLRRRCLRGVKISATLVRSLLRWGVALTQEYQVNFDPYKNFKFQVVIENTIIGGFKSLSSMDSETVVMGEPLVRCDS